jgi:histidinol-phosphate/aromatic aminotransferase/cobyric acid decarboxylase-like protein
MNLPRHAHGGDGVRLARALGVPVEQVLDLSASLNPVAPDVSEIVAGAASAVRRYPDPEPARDALAAVIGIDRHRVVLTNGGAEAIALVAQLYPEGRVDDPDFSLYARHLQRLRPDAPRWRSNPHNPTGRLAAGGDRAAVWDEAFYPLATGTWTRGDGGAIVLGSLTKVFACPGLRIGYVLAPDGDLAARLLAQQPEWSVNALACEALPALLEAANLPKWSRVVVERREDLERVLDEAGLRNEPSDANFVLVRRAPGAWEHLAHRRVLVRDTGSFGIPDGIRVAVPDAEGLDRLATALAGFRC